MTTLLCDYVNSIVTADTRWSIGGNPASPLILSDQKRYLIYCDDTGFDKLTPYQDTFVLMTAGSSEYIAKWKEWWLVSRDMASTPPVCDENGIPQVALAIVDLVDSTTLFDFGLGHALYCQDEQIVKAFSAGSGGEFAAAALFECGCAKTSIQIAALSDYCTSPEVKFVCNTTKQNNLSPTIYDINIINQAIVSRGFIMELNQAAVNKPVKLSEHPLFNEVVAQLESGKTVPSAPAPRLHSAEWTAETESKLAKAMEVVNSRIS